MKILDNTIRKKLNITNVESNLNNFYMLICPVNTDECKTAINEFYSDRKNYTTDSGLDLCCVRDQVIPGMIINNQSNQSNQSNEWIYGENNSSYLGVGIELGICCNGFTIKNIYNMNRIPVEDKAYRLVPRSSIYKTPLRLSNSEGIIDASYRGQIIAKVDNLSPYDYHIKRGDRLFQLVAPDLTPIRFTIVDTLDETERGSCGFGSTGKG
jgi:dUTP pyrophosphatase